MIFSKVANALGGKVRFAVSGSAPLAPHVEEFMRVTLCCVVAQGYGLTESCGASFSAGPDWVTTPPFPPVSPSWGTTPASLACSI